MILFFDLHQGTSENEINSVVDAMHTKTCIYNIINTTQNNIGFTLFQSVLACRHLPPPSHNKQTNTLYHFIFFLMKIFTSHKLFKLTNK